MSQRVIANHNRARAGLRRTAQLVWVIALTACAQQGGQMGAHQRKASVGAQVGEPVSARVRGGGPDVANAHLFGAPRPLASQPYRATNPPPDQPPSDAVVAPVSVNPITATPPANVVGLTLSDVRRALGEPADRRTSGGTQTWIYRDNGCSFELTSFYDVSSGDFVVLSQHTLPDDAHSNGCTG